MSICLSVCVLCMHVCSHWFCSGHFVCAFSSVASERQVIMFAACARFSLSEQPCRKWRWRERREGGWSGDKQQQHCPINMCHCYKACRPSALCLRRTSSSGALCQCRVNKENCLRAKGLLVKHLKSTQVSSSGRLLLQRPTRGKLWKVKLL